MKRRPGLVEYALVLVLVGLVVMTSMLLFTGMPGAISSDQLIIQEQLVQIDKLLSQSMRASIAYNAPVRMKLDETDIIQLLLSPSVSGEQLADQITETGPVITSTIEVTPRMKAGLTAQDQDAFIIHPIQDSPEQLISGTEGTKWEWLITAKKGGPQVLTLVIYRLIQYQGQDYWREVEAYKANIYVDVTFVQRLESLDWKWLVGIFLTALLIPAFWRYLDRRIKNAKKHKNETKPQSRRKMKRPS